MIIRHKQIIDIGLSALFGLALTATVATRFLFNPLETRQHWLIALFVLSGLGTGIVYFIVPRLIWPTFMASSVKTRFILIILAMVAPTYFLVIGEARPKTMLWVAAGEREAEQSLTIIDRSAWGEHHSGFEIHATINDDPQWVWHARADLPKIIKQFGGTLQLLVSQPNWAVLDEVGNVHPDADGVEIRFVIEQDGKQETVQHLTLNLHAHPEQRRWQQVKLQIPAGSQRLRIEALPGPSGSNNWYDRVWISVERITALPDKFIRLADWLSIGLLAFGSGAAMVLLYRTSLNWRFLYDANYIERRLNSDTVSTALLKSLWLAFRRFGWLFTGMTCLALGYLLVWQRGFYYDDYIYAAYIDLFSRPLAKMLILDPFFSPFPIRALSTLTNFSMVWLISNHEFLGRLISALGTGVNALLLGLLVYRLLGSRLAAVVSGWLFLMPFYAQEAVLWAGATSYILGSSLILLALHAFWSAFSHGRIAGRWLALGVFASMLMLIQAERLPFMLALIPAFALVAAIRHNSWKLVKQSLFVAICLSGTMALFFYLFYYNSLIVNRRGGLDLNPYGLIERSQFFLERLSHLTFSPDWGWPRLIETFDLGFAMVFQTWVGVMLFATAFTAFLVTILSWHRHEQEYLASYRAGLVMCGTGAVWFTINLLFPAILVKDQWLSSRMLYAPAAGASITIGTLAWLISKLSGHSLWPKFFIMITGLALILSTVVMLGYGRTFAARSRLDQKQIAAVVKTFPSEYLPQNTVFVPYKTDESLSEPFHFGDGLYGIFETDRAAPFAMMRAYQRDDLRAFTSNRWVGMHFDYTCNQEPASDILNVQGAHGMIDVPIEQMVMFNYKTGKVTVVESLTLVETDNTQCTVQFPLAERLRRHGTQTTKLVTSTTN